MVVEVLQMYNAQQEKLQSTLRKQQQLEKVLNLHVCHVSLNRRGTKDQDWSFFPQKIRNKIISEIIRKKSITISGAKYKHTHTHQDAEESEWIFVVT